jgi:quinol monooxygenase YgiN
MRFLGIALMGMVVGATLFSGGIQAQQQPDPLQGPTNPSPLYVATFIDLMPPGVVAGTALIKQYVLDTRKETGIRRCEAIAQIAGRANHLIIMEVWQDEAAFEKHESAAHTRDFRTKMQPLIGAPFDQREHFLVQ